MRTIILVLLNLAMINGHLVIPGVYGRDPAMTGGMSCTSLLDCNGGTGMCDKVHGFNGTVCVCPEEYSNIDCSHHRTISYLGILLVLLGWSSVGHILFTALTSQMLQILLPVFFAYILCMVLYCCCKHDNWSRSAIDPAYRRNELFRMLISIAITGINLFNIVFGSMIMARYFTDNDGYEMYSK
jgi:hypothetical protein